MHGFRMFFKGEKQFSPINCPSFTSISHDIRTFFNHPCLHVDSLNRSYAAAKVVLCINMYIFKWWLLLLFL